MIKDLPEQQSSSQFPLSRSFKLFVIFVRIFFLRVHRQRYLMYECAEQTRRVRHLIFETEGIAQEISSSFVDHESYCFGTAVFHKSKNIFQRRQSDTPNDLPREDLTCLTCSRHQKGHATSWAKGVVSKALVENSDDVHRVPDLPTAIIVMACLSSLAPPLVCVTNLLV